MHIEKPIDTTPGKIKLVSNLASKYTWGTIFTACIVYATVCSRLSIVCWHFHTCCTGKIFEGHVVTVLEWGSHQIGLCYFGFFSILFYQLWGCVYWGFLPIFFSNFMGGSYTCVCPIHRCIRYLASIVAPNVGHSEPILSQTGGTIYKFNILYMFYLYWKVS